MSKGINIRVKGIDKILKAFDTMPQRMQKPIDQELKNAAIELHAAAVQKAPADEGSLRNAINVRHGKLSHQVTMNKQHGVYQEFGTKGKYNAPAWLGSYPSRFRGKGTGTYQEALRSMQGWVKRKGIAGTYSTKTRRRTGNAATREKQDRQVAYLILRKILKEGMKPQPYFFTQFPVIRRRAVSRIKAIVKAEIRK